MKYDEQWLDFGWIEEHGEYETRKDLDKGYE
jgi:hypothetical protein